MCRLIIFIISALSFAPVCVLVEGGGEETTVALGQTSLFFFFLISLFFRFHSVLIR